MEKLHQDGYRIIEGEHCIADLYHACTDNDLDAAMSKAQAIVTACNAYPALKALNAELVKALRAISIQLTACLEVMSEFQEAKTTPYWIQENSQTRIINGEPELKDARAILARAKEVK